jgi:hypothetical protein
MSGYTRWSDIRAAHVARAGGEEAVAAGKEQLLAEVQGYRLAEIRRSRILLGRVLEVGEGGQTPALTRVVAID